MNFDFPGGLHRTLIIAATAGNAIANLSPGANRRWKILRGTITLITDATVANRRLECRILGDGTNVSIHLFEGAVHAASLTRYVAFGEPRYVVTGAFGSSPNLGIFGIKPILLDGDGIMRFYIAAGVVGDSYSGVVDVLEVVV